MPREGTLSEVCLSCEGTDERDLLPPEGADSNAGGGVGMILPSQLGWFGWDGMVWIIGTSWDL